MVRVSKLSVPGDKWSCIAFYDLASNITYGDYGYFNHILLVKSVPSSHRYKRGNTDSVMGRISKNLQQVFKTTMDLLT
jgi:hypothetical protein